MPADFEANPDSRDAASRLLRSPWMWAGVFAAGVTMLGAFALIAERDKRVAREAFDKALADYRAAGLPDPFVAPKAPASVPTAAQGNLLFAPVFDGLCVIRRGSGRYASFSMNENAAIRAKADDVGHFIFSAPGAPFWAFDPAAHFANKSKLSRLVAAPRPGELPNRAFITTLESEFPELKSLAQIESSHPLAVSPAPEWSVFDFFGMPMPEFKSARATGFVLTAYAGCKALEGDGAPAAAAVCGLARHFEATGAKEGQMLVSTMIDVVIAKLAIPRLTHGAIREGVWTDEQLRRVCDCLGRVRFKQAVDAAVSNEIRSSVFALKGVWEKEPEALRWADQLASLGFSESPEWQDALREPGVRRTGEALLRFLLHQAQTRNAAGQIDVAKRVAYADAVALHSDSPSNAYLYMLVPAYQKVLANAAIADAQVSLARLACALELYRRAHGAYPEKLDALVPAYLPALPVSPWVGGTLEYVVTPAGYTLTWPKADYYDTGLGGVRVEVKHPGPWDVFGYEIKLPERMRWFDTRTVTTTTAIPKDIVWTMPAPKDSRTAESK